MTPNQFAGVSASLVKSHGIPLADLSEAAQCALGELGEALMKDGVAKDACIERAMELLHGIA